jgi:hypothetical protein
MKSINAEEFKNRRLAEPVDDKKLIKMLQSNSLTVEEIAETFNVPFATVSEKINLLKSNKALFRKEDEKFSINETPIEGGRKVLNPDLWRGDVIKFGFTADNHLCSYFERLDVLNLIYDICEGENIPVVLNGGNWIDGEARFNRNEIHKVGLDRQINYAVDVYPYRKGIETWFVSGDDHEGWYNQREGINIGDYWQMKREQAGMFDLKHLGYVEADIDLNEGKFENGSWLRVMHAGGGSSYATSYSAQKIVESLQGGEKPSVLMIGHYHKLLYAYIRNVHTVQCGTTQDQSIFMRKKKIEAHVGGGIIELYRDKYGSINRVRVDFITAFDKKFYVGKDKYWKS